MRLVLGKSVQLRNSLQRIAPRFYVPNCLCSSLSNVEAFITNNSNPANQTIKDIGLFYTIPNDISHKILFNRIFVRNYFEECQTFNETPFLIRKPAFEIINYLKNANYDSPINKYVLYGKFGSGKTFTMLHVIHYAHLENWLIFHVPKLSSWIFPKFEISPSLSNSGLLDVPTVGSVWLKHFKSQNESIIKKLDIKITNDYKWNIKEENKKGESLLELINHGINRLKYSCDVINALMNEIKHLSKEKKIKTLVAIDGYNLIFQPKTKIRDGNRRFVTPEEISCITGFKNLLKSDWHNGAAIITCDQLENQKRNSHPARNKLKDYHPAELLGTSGLEFLHPFVPIEVPPLTEKEMTSVLDYYKSKKWLLNSKGDEEFKFLSAGNHLILRKLCGPA